MSTAYPPRVGRKIGMLTILERVELSGRKDGDHAYLCSCECGGTVVARWKSLQNGCRTSCGCLYAAREEKHQQHRADGLSLRKHPLGVTYNGMIKRCYEVQRMNYKHYGGRGITVCDTWRNAFSAFVRDMGPKPTQKHTLDRIDPNGNYEPGNCRWATKEEQHTNKRVSVVPIYRATIRGKENTVAAWARKFGVDDEKIKRHIREGVAPDVAVISAVLRKNVWSAGGNDYSKCQEQAEHWCRKPRHPIPRL